MTNTFLPIQMNNVQQIRNIMQIMFPYQTAVDYDSQCEKGGTFGTGIHEQVYAILPLREEMERLGLLECWRSTVLIVSSSELGLHGDGDSRYSYTLVFPVWNTENTVTQFYESSVPPVDVVMEQEGSSFTLHGYDINNCKLIDSVEIVEPTIINVDTPHRVIHNGTNSKVRVTAAIRLHDKEAVEKALQKLHEH